MMSLHPRSARDGDVRRKHRRTSPPTICPSRSARFPRSEGGAGGTLGEIQVGEQTIATDPAALKRELDKYFQDPNLPFDQTMLKVDPNLKYSELMKVINAFMNAFADAKKEPKLSFDELVPSAKENKRRGTARLRSFVVRSCRGCWSWPSSWSWAGSCSGSTPRSGRSRPSRRSRRPRSPSRSSPTVDGVRDGHRSNADLVSR